MLAINGARPSTPPRPIGPLLPPREGMYPFCSQFAICSLPWSSDREIKDDFSVLLQGNRPKISATVGADGIARLKQVLDKYEEILKLLQ